MPEFKPYRAHVFVCTNVKEGKECCGAKDSAQLKDELKSLCKELGKEVRVSQSGCLGRCEDGIACVVYPQSSWKTHLQKDDAQEVFAWIKSIIK